MIRFGSYNIQNGRNVGLELALHRMDQDSIDLGIIQEMNIKSGFYMRASSGFCMVEKDAPSRHHWGVTLFYKY